MKRNIALIILCVVSQLALAQNPIAYYPFNGNAQDETGNGHHGNVNGATLTTDRFGTPNSAYFFDGINDYIDLTNPVGLQSLNYTFSLWAKPASNPLGTAHCALSIGGNGGDQFISNLNAFGDVGWNLSGYQLPSGTFDLVSGVSPNVDSWYYIVGIRSSTYSLLYVNGVLVDSMPFSNSTSPNYGQNFANIGRRTFNQFQYFHGAIDEVKIFNTAFVPSLELTSPFRSCWEILQANPSAPTGSYTIDVDGPGGMNAFACSCDMTTDGGGWTLVSNYNHLSGTNPSLQYRNTDLPIMGSSTLGTDESGTSFWGNATNSLMNLIPFDTIQWYGTSSQAGKITHFKSGYLGAWTMAKTGNGDYTGMNSSKVVYPDNTSVNINCIATSGLYGNNWANLMQCFGVDIWSVGIQSSGACTPFPGWPNIWQWSIDASYCDNNHPNSLHRIWVKGPNPCNLFSNAPNMSVLNSSTICQDGSWKHISNPSNANEIIASVDDNDLALGTLTASVYLEGSATGLYNGQHFLKRHYVISTQNNPLGSKRVRLYFTSSELNDLISADPSVNGIQDLKITKYSGPTADGIYNPNDATSIQLIPPASITTGSLYGVLYLEFDVDGFSEFWIHGGSNAPLPVQMMSFNGEVCGENNCLTWVTRNEMNISHYDIQRSTNGVEFNAYAQIYNIANKMEETTYHYKDVKPLEGKSYYRLASIDIDGSKSFSHVIALNHSSLDEIEVVPTSSRSGLYSIISTQAVDDYQLFSLTGQLIFHSKKSNAINLSNLSAGIYFVKIKSGNNIQTIKIIKE